MPVATQTHNQGAAHPREEGQAAIEAMVALPAFLLLCALLLQSALLGLGKVAVQYAAFSAARVGAVRGGEEKAMRPAARRVLGWVPGCQGFPGPDFTLQPTTIPPSSPPPLPSPPSGRLPAPTLLRVDITWRFPLLVPLAGALMGGWRGEGSWFRPSLPLRGSWITVREELSFPGEGS